MVNLDYPVFKAAATEKGVGDAWVYGNMVMDQFKKGFPVLFDLMHYVEDTVRNQGYIVSLGGRKRHKPRPEWNEQSHKWTVPYYKMTSHFIQGSAAEYLKKGLEITQDAGVFEEIPMHLSVHDENVGSVSFDKHGIDALITMQECMEKAYEDIMSVPVPCAVEMGPNWGYWSNDIFEEMKKGIFAEDAWQRVYAPKVNDDWWCIQNGYKGLDGVLKHSTKKRMQ